MSLLNSIRLNIAEKLLFVVVLIAPKDEQGTRLVEWILLYCEAVISEEEGVYSLRQMVEKEEQE